MEIYMSDNPKHVTVRLRVPPELRDKIASSAEQYNRSMNADMVSRLEQSFEQIQSQENELSDLKNQMQRMNQTIEILSKTLASFAQRSQ